MSIIGWIVLGLIAGFVASKIVNKTGEGVILDIVLGIVGAVVGGWLFATFGASGVTGFNLYSMLVAVIGAVVGLVLYHLSPAGVPSAERGSPRGPPGASASRRRCSTAGVCRQWWVAVFRSIMGQSAADRAARRGLDREPLRVGEGRSP
jgi:uncharacterized membrane protein YeaQ/YmgE (transglycosylase-associated protein family)